MGDGVGLSRDLRRCRGLEEAGAEHPAQAPQALALPFGVGDTVLVVALDAEAVGVGLREAVLDELRPQGAVVLLRALVAGAEDDVVEDLRNGRPTHLAQHVEPVWLHLRAAHGPSAATEPALLQPAEERGVGLRGGSVAVDLPPRAVAAQEARALQLAQARPQPDDVGAHRAEHRLPWHPDGRCHLHLPLQPPGEAVGGGGGCVEVQVDPNAGPVVVGEVRAGPLSPS